MLAAVLLTLCPGVADGHAAFPGGLLAPSGRVAFLAADRGVMAVDLARGAELWRSDESHRPLFVAGDRLYSLALAGHEVRVVGHDLGRGGARASRSDPVVLPRWAAAAPRERHTFSYAARHVKHELVLQWHATARPLLGPAKEARGAARIDLRTGQVKPQGAAAAAEPPAPPRVLEKLAVRWHRTFAGQVHALVAEDLAGGAQRLWLRTWAMPAGRPALARELMRGRDLVVMVGLDDHHLWLREGSANPGAAGAEAPRAWSVYSGVDGRLVATVPVVAGTRQGLLHDGRAYLLTARPRRGAAGPARPVYELHAYDLQAGEVVWRKPLGGEK